MNDITIAIHKLTIELLLDTIKRVRSLEQGEILESEGEASMQAALQELLQRAENETIVTTGEQAG